jgi:tetratricopeptide (TPR) repeat protein
MNKNAIFAAFVIVLGFVGVFLLSSYLEHNRITVSKSYDDEDLTVQGRKLKGYALGAEGLIADWYWMRSLQYMGGKLVSKGIENINIDDLTELNPRLLYPMLDNATDLDPKLMAAFSYGATILPAVDAQQAIKLTEKGIAHNPDQWRLYQYLGYIYWKLNDFERAAMTYESGSKVPGAPEFFNWMAIRMRSEASDRETARAMYKQMLAEAIDDQSKMIAEFRLKEFAALDEREAIDRALAQLKERTGRCPGRISEVVPLLSTVRLPAGNEFRLDASGNLVDPFESPYSLDTTTCNVNQTATSRPHAQ